MTWTPFLLIGPRCLTDVSILAPFVARPTTAPVILEGSSNFGDLVTRPDMAVLPCH